MNQHKSYLYDGSDWEEHEDFLVGNTEGLEKLKVSIDEALEKGISTKGIGDYVGIKKLDTSFFEKKRGVNDSILSQILTFFMTSTAIIVFIVGVLNSLKWIKSFF